MRTSSRLLAAGLAVLGLVAASCGDDDDSADTATTAAAATTVVAAPATTSAASATTAGATTTKATTATTTTAAATTTAAPAAGDITVLAAASLSNAFKEIATAFGTANPGANVTFSFAGSNDLAAQINQGAPSDVFASADQSNMKKVTDAANTQGEPVIFATNLLEIIVAPGNPKGIKGVADLANPDLTVITCDPAVPCGTYAQQVFQAAGVSVTPKSLEQDVNAVTTKIVNGAGDAGIVYATNVQSSGEKAAGVEIPKEINVIAQYPIAITKQSGNPATAQAFIDFVLGDQGQQILAKYGFTGP
jgi:molybdate transport system substrate-binding protein